MENLNLHYFLIKATILQSEILVFVFIILFKNILQDLGIHHLHDSDEIVCDKLTKQIYFPLGNCRDKMNNENIHVGITQAFYCVCVCVHFYCTTKSISQVYTYTPSILDFPVTLLSHCTPLGQYRIPNGANSHQLSISHFTHGNACMSILLSQFIPSSTHFPYIHKSGSMSQSLFQGRNREADKEN